MSKWFWAAYAVMDGEAINKRRIYIHNGSGISYNNMTLDAPILVTLQSKYY